MQNYIPIYSTDNLNVFEWRNFYSETMIKIGLNMVAILATLKPKYVSGLLSDSTTDCHGPFCSNIPIILLVYEPSCPKRSSHENTSMHFLLSCPKFRGIKKSHLTALCELSSQRSANTNLPNIASTFVIWQIVYICLTGVQHTKKPTCIFNDKQLPLDNALLPSISHISDTY